MGYRARLDAGRGPVVPRGGGRRTHRRASRRLILLGLLAACAPAPRWQGLVKIGLILPFHGDNPRLAEAIHVAVRDVLIARNRAGGVDGRRLELVSLDSWSDSATAHARAAELIADPFVRAVLVGATGTDAALAVLAAAGRPVASVAGPEDAVAAAERLLAEIPPP